MQPIEFFDLLSSTLESQDTRVRHWGDNEFSRFCFGNSLAENIWNFWKMQIFPFMKWSLVYSTGFTSSKKALKTPCEWLSWQYQLLVIHWSLFGEMNTKNCPMVFQFLFCGSFCTFVRIARVLAWSLSLPSLFSWIILSPLEFVNILWR